MNRPLAVARQTHILQTLEMAGSVGVSELAERFGVSRETIRRDLKALAETGRVNIVHGGAAGGAIAEPSLAARNARNSQGKAAIGRKAAGFVEDGMTIVIDSGSTTSRLAAALAARTDLTALTVLTNSLPIASALCRARGVKVTMLGGEIDANDEAAFGIDAIAALAHFRVDIAFVGAGGISPEGDFTDYSRLAAEQRRAMLACGEKAYVLADHSKFERRTPVRIQPAGNIAGLIVDALPEGSAAGARWTIILARD